MDILFIQSAFKLKINNFVDLKPLHFEWLFMSASVIHIFACKYSVICHHFSCQNSIFTWTMPSDRERVKHRDQLYLIWFDSTSQFRCFYLMSNVLGQSKSFSRSQPLYLAFQFWTINVVLCGLFAIYHVPCDTNVHYAIVCNVNNERMQLISGVETPQNQRIAFKQSVITLVVVKCSSHS